MKTKSIKFDQAIGIPLIGILFIVALMTHSGESIKLLTIAMIALNIASCRKEIKNKVVFLTFNFTFFFFLAGRTFIALLLPEVEARAISPIFDIETERMTDILIFISIMVIRLTFTVDQIKIKSEMEQIDNTYYRISVRKYSKIAAYIALIFNLLILAEKTLFVAAYGYEAYYVLFTTKLPLIFTRIAMLYEPLLFLYLCTFPSRKNTFFHLTVYLLVSAASLSYGQRNGLVLGVIFIAIYLSIRDVVTPERKLWLKRRVVMTALVFAVPLVIFLAAFTYYRSEITLPTTSKRELIAGFFVAQGSGIYNLSYAISMKNRFPQWHYYTIGPVIGFVRDNVLTQAIFGTKVMPKASTELALTGYNFSFALAYLVNPGYYARGGGFGSNYIAELWIDFGMIGVVIGGIIYGVIMSRFMYVINRFGPIICAFALAVVMQLVYSPRSGFLGFITPFMSMLTVSTYLLIHVVSKRVAKNRIKGSKRRGDSIRRDDRTANVIQRAEKDIT